MQKIIALALLSLVGCGGTSTPAIPPMTGDFVKNNDGVGTARVFGVDFSVHVDSSDASTDFAIDANLVEPGQSSAMQCFSLGDEITIQLDSIDESEVRFLFNEQDFGLLHAGDQVVIDDERNVEVNGTLPTPTTVD